MIKGFNKDPSIDLLSNVLNLSKVPALHQLDNERRILSSLLVVHEFLGEVIVDWLGEEVALVVAVAWLRLGGQTDERIVILEFNDLSWREKVNPS